VRRIKALHDLENLNAEIHYTFTHIFHSQPGLIICCGRRITGICLWSCGIVLPAHHLEAKDQYGWLGPLPSVGATCKVDICSILVCCAKFRIQIRMNIHRYDRVLQIRIRATLNFDGSRPPDRHCTLT
jgi:hypothetical protein